MDTNEIQQIKDAIEILTRYAYTEASEALKSALISEFSLLAEELRKS